MAESSICDLGVLILETSRVARGAAAVLLPNAALFAAASSAGAQQEPATTLTSQWELDNPGCDLRRDGGMSAAIPTSPGQSLWLFGDTGFPNPDGECYYNNPFGLYGTFGAVSLDTPGSVPVVSEVPTPGLSGQPGPSIDPLPNGRLTQHFLPQPQGLRLPNGAPCPSNGSVSWPSWVTQGPAGPLTLHDGASPGNDGTLVSVPEGSDLLLIGYGHVCIASAWELLGQRSNIAAYDPDTNSIVASWTVWDALSEPDPATLQWHQSLTSAVAHGDHLYGYVSTCDESTVEPEPEENPVIRCDEGRVAAVRVATDQLHNHQAYKYWSSTGWTADATEAESILPAGTGSGPWQPARVWDFSSVGRDLLMFEQVEIQGGFRVWEAESPVGPWTLVADADHRPCGDEGFCYALDAKPALSTTDDIFYSYSHSVDHGEDVYEVKVSSMGALP